MLLKISPTRRVTEIGLKEKENIFGSTHKITCYRVFEVWGHNTDAYGIQIPLNAKAESVPHPEGNSLTTD